MEERVLADRYRIVKHLARGGMADVYEAEDTLLNRAVAVKVLHANFASDEAFVARFRREAQAAANLSHPNIVAIYDWGKDAGTYFMVMELIRGRTLREIMKSDGDIMPRRSAEICAEAAAALSIAHQHGVYHRDIKPGNIMITGEGAVKVTDFGIARALDDSEELTRTGAVIGTATYFSPEQAQGLPADERSDVYALGIVLYELLAGKPPFTGESPVAVAYQHVSEPAAAPDAVNPEAPRELAAIAEHAIRKAPTDRYQSAAELKADLDRYLAGTEPIAAAVGAAAAATAMIPPPPSATPLDYGVVSAATQTFDAPAEERSQTGYWVAVGALIAILVLGLFLLWNLLSGGDPVTSDVEIPDLTNMPAQEAFEELQALDLKVRSVQENSTDIEPGNVIRTEPAAGESVPAGSFVTVVVSAGEEQFAIPNVIGENVDIARARIEAQGFVVAPIEYVQTDTVDENLVISQSPDGGTEAPPGTEVKMIVSAGPSSIEVPDVSGKSAAAAELELTRQGFENVEHQDEYSDEVLEGFVIETNPPAGTIAPIEATIVIITSLGPEPVDVPDLEGLTPSQAERALNNLGLLMAISSDTVEVPVDSGLIGTVAEQSPGAGTTLEVGETVTVRLGVVRQVTVPNVVGMDTVAAEAEIADAGLTVGTPTTQITNVQGNDGTVASQNPAGGSSVDEGTVVQLVVYVYQPDVPNFSGMTLAEAQAAADAVGLGTVSQTSTQVTGDAALVGKIVPGSQAPAAGSSVPQGTNVTVTVYVSS